MLMNWIEKIYEVDKDSYGDNIWKENYTKFEPRENTPGCYFKIEENKDKSIIEIYCGC